MQKGNTNQVCLRVHVASPSAKVFQFLTTDAGRAAFWADSAIEHDGAIHFRFSNGMEHVGRILAIEPNKRFAVEYFGASVATFSLAEDGAGGTDVTLTETSVPQEWLTEHRAGWVSVLLTLKAAVDFSIDLRNRDPQRSWEQGYVDV